MRQNEKRAVFTISAILFLACVIRAGVRGHASVYVGDRATERAVKSLEAPRILHVATHGFFLRSGLTVDSGSPGLVSRCLTTSAE